GPASEPFAGPAPVLLGSATTPVGFAITPVGSGATPANLELKPFFSQYDRRSAVYFPRLTPEQWQTGQTALAAERARLEQLEARSLVVMRFGEQQSERDHQLQSGSSEAVLYRGRHGRLARNGAAFEFRMRVNGEPSRTRPVVLQATYWGRQRDSRFRVL